MPLVNAGVTHMAQATLGEAGLTPFNNANAKIGVGNGAEGASPLTYNNLQGASRLRKGMEATYPTTLTANATSFRSVFTSAEANWAWTEWGIFNNVTDGSGTMLCRKWESAGLGTKSSGQTWTVTATITFSVGN